MTDSSNNQPNEMGPTVPIYPEIAQVCRITGPRIDPRNIYPAFVTQWTPPLTLRDREACYVWESNRIALVPGYYDSRLVGSHLGLPLFVTTCCPLGGGGVVGASSSSGSSG